MELWFTEKQTKHFGITARINRTLHTEQTEFQKTRYGRNGRVRKHAYFRWHGYDNRKKMSSFIMKW